MSVTRIDVATPSARYPILVGEDLTAHLDGRLDDLGFPARRIVVSSPRVWRLHGDRLASALAAGRAPVLVSDGERSKHLRTVSRIYDGLIAAVADRGSGLVAVGGGVIGDMAGFAAATYLRGIAVVHVPTTLLAQVDSAVGGKTGVNLPQGKNLVGCFHQPAAVLVDPSFLSTLSGREFRAGMYEVLKYAMACSLPLFERLEHNPEAMTRRDVAALLPVIEECCRIKAGVVAEDEREQGVRRVLNFGHTAGHAFEAVTRYARFRHGEAVAWGMLLSCHLAQSRGGLAPGDRETFARLLFGFGELPTIGDLRSSDVLEAIGRDKKIVEGRLNFVLPVAIGRVEIVQDVTSDQLRAALVAVGCANE